ncbi:MAG: histidine kinase [Lacrimispora sp.]
MEKELELEVLMGQINPHFLYNTLENIVWKSNEVGRPDIGRIAAALGGLYRLSIGNGETIVPVKQELEHVTAYVNIQKNRYKERVEFDMEVDYDQVWGFSMIKLTLQPVVENCFMYAMEDINHILKIRLDIRVLKDIIRFRVADNGCGMTKSQLKEVRNQIENGVMGEERLSVKQKRKGTGIGLYSVKERIAIYTGYRDSVKIFSKPGVGTIVTITVPQIISQDKNNQ